MDYNSLLFKIAKRFQDMSEDEKRLYLKILKFSFNGSDNEIADDFFAEQPIFYYNEQDEKGYFLH